jgi:clan AA aspartic protease
MGVTYLDVEVANPASPNAGESVRFLVDSGAIYSVVPFDVLARLNITPTSTQAFGLADGSKIERRRGGALFRYGDRVGTAEVIFCEAGDASLLGAHTLEALGLGLDPLKRELIPLPMLLATTDDA